MQVDSVRRRRLRFREAHKDTMGSLFESVDVKFTALAQDQCEGAICKERREKRSCLGEEGAGHGALCQSTLDGR